MWDAETDEWTMHRLELAGNRMRVRRPPSTLTRAFDVLLSSVPMNQARPTTQFAALSAARGDPATAARFKADNIAAMDLEWVAGTSESYSGPAAAQKLNVASTVRTVTSDAAQGMLRR